jgi:hypothetical protein
VYKGSNQESQFLLEGTMYDRSHVNQIAAIGFMVGMEGKH